MYGYKCPHCKSERKETTTTRSKDGKSIRITVLYECGSFFSLEKEGAVFKPSDREYRCKIKTSY